MIEALPVVIPHIDDVGGSHSANVAMVELAEMGSVTSGSVMVPPGWLPEIAAQAGPMGLDLGVHMTLTSESAALRWGPVSTTDSSSGLTDPTGYLWSTVPELRRHAGPDEAAVEIRAQIDHALDAGVDVTHLDSHMGAALAPEFVERTVDIAIEHRLPLLFPVDLAGYFRVLNVGPLDIEPIARQRRRAADAGVAVGERFVMPLEHQDRTDHDAILRRLLNNPGAGVTWVSLHCAANGDIEAIHPQDADWRLGEYRTFSDPRFGSWLRGQPFGRSGLRELRDRLRG